MKRAWVVGIVVLLLATSLHYLATTRFYENGSVVYRSEITAFNTEHISSEYIQTPAEILDGFVYIVSVKNLSIQSNYLFVFEQQTVVLSNCTHYSVFLQMPVPFYVFKFIKESKLDLKYVLIYSLEWR